MEYEKNKTILIVDDDIDIRQLLVRKLTRQGYTLIEAVDGVDGLEKLKSALPDLVLVDVMMPRMNGYQFCEEASKLDSADFIPIIIMTARDDPESVNLAYEKGATEFITKPINQAKLTHRILFSLRASEISEKLANRERQLLSAQKIAKMGEWYYDLKRNEFKFSDEVANIFGMLGKENVSYKDLLASIDEADVKRVSDTFENLVNNSTDHNIEYTIQLQDGVKKRVRQVIDAKNDDLDNRNIVFGIIQDITDLREAEQKVKTLSFYDGLTGLPNRHFFKRMLKKTMASSKRHNRSFALLDINLDKFTRINTALGRDIGDKILIAASRRLDDAIRDSDMVYSDSDEGAYSSGILAHLGGDNFIVLLNELNSADDAAKVARRINHVFEESFNVLANEIHLSVSIGIGIFPDDGDNVDDLLNKVSTALDNAKSTGRNCYRFYAKKMNDMSFKRLSMEVNLRKAFEQDQLSLYYQPKINLLNGQITGAEALIRWQHPDMGFVSPAEFIPIAESTDLIKPMTDWVIAESCRQLASWDEKGFRLRSVAINVTPASLYNKKFNDYVHEQSMMMGIEGERLDFEITESVLMEDVDMILPILHDLRDVGASISIDDFGTGYSSLSYLKQLPVSKLKIDQSFIHDLMHNKDDSIIVNAVISLAQSLGFMVIAEGVEDEQQLAYLKEHGCDVVQGYFYTPPLPADDFYYWCTNYESVLTKQELVIVAG
jgi:diguanylate cyclase (GGDEF)-like protein